MKKTIKQTLALFLAALVFCSAATAVFAVPQMDERDDTAYAIYALESDGKTVTATVSNAQACTLVVALYDDAAQMLGTGVAQIEADCGQADVALDVDTMPEYYVLKAFLLDKNNCALCKNYETRQYARPDGDLSQCSVGDIISFGSYPQTRVTDQDTLLKLDAQSKNKTWTAYPYYIETKRANFMYYIDLQIGTERYRGVRIDQYRPFYTADFSGNTSSAANSQQDENGYLRNCTYWFRYEPLQWRVLNPYTGFVMSESILDSQNFQVSKNAPASGKYANNWAKSSLRQWLNTTFLNEAFNDAEQAQIRITTLDTPCPYSGYSKYNVGKTDDRVFLLSWYDAVNPIYGFANNISGDASRRAYGTDYAKCQGLEVFSSNGCSHWRLRTPSYHRPFEGVSIDYYGAYIDSRNVTNTSFGVRPALQLDPGPEISISSQTASMLKSAPQTEGTQTVQQGETYTTAKNDTVAGREYVLLVREAGSKTLWYIDQQTAAADTVSFTYVPSCSGVCTVEIVGAADSLPAAYTVSLTSFTPPLDKEDEEEYTDRGYALEGGTVTGGVYDEGTEVTLTAVPNAYYKFVGWYNGSTLVNAEATYTFAATADVSLTARFIKNGDVNGDGYVDAGDAARIIRHLVAGSPEQDPMLRQPWQLAVGDVNNSFDPDDPDSGTLADEVDAGDATLILRFLVDPGRVLPC